MTRKRLATWSFSIAITAGASPFLTAASAPVIGMTSSQNGVTLDNSKVSGNATLFEGVKVQSAGYSRLHLTNGTRLDLAAGSQVQLFANHAAMTSGTSEMQSPSGFEIDTTSLKITSTDAKSIARVKIDSDLVYVTALNAPVTVMNSRGLLVAKVAPGMPMSFMAQGATAMNSFDVSGCVLQKSGAAIVNDENGHQVSELRGADLRKAVGNQTHIVGTVDATATAMGGATQVVKVSSVTVTKKGGCTAQATALGATTAAVGLGAAATAGAGVAVGTAAGVGAAAAGVGLGTAAAVSVGVAAAAAATVGGLAASGAILNSSPE